MKPVLLFLPVLLFSCSSGFDEEKERQAILELHEAQRGYHFQKKAEEFAGLMSENYISVNRGQVSRPSYEENVARFGNYFDSVEFVKWDDVQPPEVRFSDDGSMAYTVVEKQVVVTYPDERGGTIADTTDFAWIAVYKKYAKGWKIDCVASTDR
ncbi:MAG: hypothetical protein H6560_20170 [Lewinellaceae bacterium]|nr:hypothetical protein [Lewinellaceae bacterium]